MAVNGNDPLHGASDELIRAIRDLTEQERRAAIKQEAYDIVHGVNPIGTPGGVGMSPAQTQSVGAFWKSAEKVDSAAGQGLSVMQQFLTASGGASGAAAASAMGQLAAGGFSPGAAAAVGASVGIGRELIAPAAAGFETKIESLARGSAFHSEDFLNQKAILESGVSEIQAERKSELRQGLAGITGGGYGRFGASPADNEEAWLQGKAREQRQAQARLDEFTTVERDTERRTESFFAPLAAGGGRPGKGQIEEVAKFFHMQSEASFRIHADVQEVVSRISANKPGMESQQGKR